MNYKQMLDKFKYLEQKIEQLESQVQKLQQQHYTPVPSPMPQTHWQMPIPVTCHTNPQDAF